MRRRYAEGTSVPVAKSKGEIDKLLEGWGADRILWEEDFREGRIVLRFVWTQDAQAYAARLAISVPTVKEVREMKEVMDGRTGNVNENKVAKIMERAGRAEMRLLLLWLKASFNAVEAGIIDPKVIFLPFFENEEGDTVADVVIPNLPSLLSGKIFKQLKA